MLVNKNFTDVGNAEKMYSQRRVSELCNVFPSVFRHSLQYFGMFYALIWKPFISFRINNEIILLLILNRDLSVLNNNVSSASKYATSLANLLSCSCHTFAIYVLQETCIKYTQLLRFEYVFCR